MRKAVAHLKAADPVLARIIRRVGPCRMTFGDPTFHSLARSIVYQQLHGKAAATIFARVTDLAGDPLTPESLLQLKPEQLRQAGLSGQKASYITDLAQKAATCEIDFAKIPRLRNDAVIAQLTQVKGIGVWTAHMFLMFSLRRPDVFPTGDLGIRNAIKRAYEMETTPTPAEMEAVADRWQPYRSVACWYLWRSLELEE